MPKTPDPYGPPAWYRDPRPGDRIEADDGRTREVIERSGDHVSFRDHYGCQDTISLSSWRAWADRNRAKIDFYGS
jgi:hypothetical protein